MRPERVMRLGLSARVTLVTLAAVVAAVVLVLAISVAGVYNLARAEDASRLAAYRSLMTDELTARFTLVDRLLDTLASSTGTAGVEPEGLENAARRAAEANPEYLDAVAFTDARGAVIAAYPPERVPGSIGSATMEAGSVSGVAFAYEETGDPESSRLWVIRRVTYASGGVSVVARVRPEFLTRIVDDVATSRSSVSALIVDEHGDLVRVGVSSVPFPSRTIRFTPAEPGSSVGEARVADSAAGPLAGLYSDVVAAPELGWKVVVLDSERDALTRSRDALLPASLASLFVAIAAVAFAALYSRRLLAPVKAFEKRAREVASGGYVRPMAVVRDDELGLMADSFNEMAVRLNSLIDVAQLIATASKLDDVLDAVISAVGHILGTGDVAILLADPESESLALARGKGLAIPAATFLVPLDEPSPITEAYHEQRPATFQGPEGEWAGQIHRIFGAHRERAGAVIPLVMGVDVLGVVVVLAPGRRGFTDAQLETLRAFSANAAVAVRNSRLFEHEHLARMEAEGLREVAELIAHPSELEHALMRAGEIAAGLLEAGRWALAVEGRAQLGMPAASDPEAERRLMRAWRTVAPDDGDGPRFDPVVVPDVRADAALRELLPSDAGSALFVPLVQGSTVRGVLMLLDRGRGRAPQPRQLSFASAIGKELSLAIRGAYLLQQARTRAANLETVFRISQAVSSELQINVVLNRVLDVVQKIFSADAVALMGHDPAADVIGTTMARGVSNRDLLYFSVRPGIDIPGRVFETRSPAFHGELARVSTPLARLAVSQGLHSCIIVPLLARGRSIGVLAVYAHTADAFSGEDMELLLTFAAQAALAIDTAALYGKEHHVSSVLQASILPERIAPFPGVEAETFYVTAGTEADIGGDYYDAFPTRDGRLVLAIGDVCGKGVLAATKTSMIKYALRGLVAGGADPARALRELNHIVSVTGDPADIVTVWVGVYDPATGVLTYGNGGHPPGLLRRADSRRIERLAATGPLLGAVDDIEFGEEQVPLGPGDTLLLYTDGVTEARRGALFFGEGRVRRVLRREGGALAVAEGLLAAIRAFSAGPLRDDAAALVVRRLDGAPTDAEAVAGPSIAPGPDAGVGPLGDG